MSRKLVICCDGTWNTPTQKDRGRVVPSNVVKMARLVEDGPSQLLYYDTGVGTRKGLDKWSGGGLGIGLTDNIKQAYRHICSTFQDDDQLFLFGFSRGAYTVRSLAGLIGYCGLVSPDNKSIEQAYRVYREATDDKGRIQAAEFKAGQRHADIQFLGVWDTVGALGVPALSRFGLLRKLTLKACKKIRPLKKYAHGFHDTGLGEHIINACHAIAIDEKRGPFAPSLWEKKDNNNKTSVEQVWFPGVHCNVGGGYLDTGISDHSLMWMALKAKDAGLQLNQQYLAIRLDPNAHGELRDSMSTMYRIMPKNIRQPGNGNTLNEKLHYSVRKRVEHPTNKDYPPKNLESVLNVSEQGGIRKIMTSTIGFDETGSSVVSDIRGDIYKPGSTTSAGKKGEQPVA